MRLPRSLKNPIKVYLRVTSYRAIYNNVCQCMFTNNITCYVIFQIRVSVLDVVSKSKCHEQWRGAAEPLFVALWDLEAKSKTLTRI